MSPIRRATGLESPADVSAGRLGGPAAAAHLCMPRIDSKSIQRETNSVATLNTATQHRRQSSVADVPVSSERLDSCHTCSPLVDRLKVTRQSQDHRSGLSEDLSLPCRRQQAKRYHIQLPALQNFL